MSWLEGATVGSHWVSGANTDITIDLTLESGNYTVYIVSVLCHGSSRKYQPTIHLSSVSSLVFLTNLWKYQTSAPYVTAAPLQP